MIVSISGIDGSGKSSLAKALEDRLKRGGLPAHLVKPEYAANETVKDFCEAEYGDRFAYFRQVDPDFYISCLTADWLRFRVKTLASSASSILICDRYIHDVLAQATHMGAEARELRRQIDLFPKAEVSIFINIDPKTAHERLLAREGQPIHEAEGLEELHVLDRAYCYIKQETGWDPKVVDATDPLDAIADRIERVIVSKWEQLWV